MKIRAQHTYEKVILGLEVIGFAIVILVAWLDEYVDVPHRFLGAVAVKAAARPQEFWFEALTALLVGTVVVVATLWVFRRLRMLEGFIQVCAWCRKVNLGDEWISFEQYLKREHDVKSSHSICPACRATATIRPAAAILK
jgi:H+/Cl- antiporter ClcA